LISGGEKRRSTEEGFIEKKGKRGLEESKRSSVKDLRDRRKRRVVSVETRKKKERKNPRMGRGVQKGRQAALLLPKPWVSECTRTAHKKEEILY